MSLCRCLSIINTIYRSAALGTCLIDLERGVSGEVVRQQKKSIKRKRKHQLSLVSLCLVLSATCTVFECFALLNIQFCDREDLTQLYWGFWTLLSVGSNIAILGVMVQFWIVLGDHDTPSWAVALGTPVLVFAAVGFVFHSIGAQTWERCRGKPVQEGENPEEGNESSRSEMDVEKYDRERSMSQV